MSKAVGVGIRSREPLSSAEVASERGFNRRELVHRGVVSAAGLSALPALLAACGGSEASADVSTINWAQSAGPPDMNPLRRFDVEGAMVLALGVETLVRFDNDFKIAPLLASDYKRSADLTEWTYRLRDGVHFWDGRPLTMDDVLYSYEQHLTNPQSAFGYFYEIVADVRARGKTDLVIRLKRPSVTFQYTPAHTAGMIWQKSSAEQMGRKLGTPGNLPVGSGPFSFVDYAQNNRVTLERNDQYWDSGAQTPVENLNVRTIPDDSSRLLAMQSGEISGTFDVPPEQYDQWANSSGLDVTKAEGLGVVFLAFNVRKAPFDDVHVRRAFSYAIDRTGLVDTAIHGAGEVATAFVPPRFWQSLDVSRDEVLSRYGSFPQYDFDIDKAKAELKQSKYSGGLSVDVDYPNNYRRLGKLLLNLKQNLAPMGATINIREVNEDQWFADYYEGRTQVALNVILYRPDYPDPENYASFFASDQIRSGNNFFQYSNPAVDRLLMVQSATADPAERVDPLMKVLEIVNQDAVAASVWWESSLLSTRSGITAYANPVWYFVPWALSIQKA